MFSSRTPASLQPNHLTQTLTRLRERGAEWIDLTVSNPTRVGLPYAAEEILAALGDPRALTYEPAAFGPLKDGQLPFAGAGCGSVGARSGPLRTSFRSVRGAASPSGRHVLPCRMIRRGTQSSATASRDTWLPSVLKA